LFAIHGAVAVAKPCNGANHSEMGQIRKSEDFCSNADGCKQCVGGTAEDGCIAESRCQCGWNAQTGSQSSPQTSTNGE